MRARQIPRWLRGDAWASPHGPTSVRVNLENNSGTRAEVYLTLSQAREMRDSLNYILAARSVRPQGANPAGLS